MGEPLANLLFEYPCADTILRSHDTHHFRVPKSYIGNSSPVLDRLIRTALRPPDDTHEEASLPVIPLPESGAILHSLLTFIFPVIPLLPSTTEESMELLSVAQKYQMESVLAHIRLNIARHYLPSTQRGAAHHMYSLAHKYGLREEALQAARIILKYPINIEDLEDKLDVMSGGSLYELCKYSERVRGILASDLTEFRSSGACSTLTGLRCAQLSSSQIPRWLDDYIASIGDAPNLFDLIEFNIAMTRHVAASNRRCTCGSIPSQTIRNFWEALASVVDDSFTKAESTVSLVQEQENSQAQVNSGASVPEPLYFPNADLVIQSSDLVNFHVHKSVLAIASPVFKDLLSLHQPSGSDSVDGLPVVQLTEDAELWNSLLSMIYPVRLVVPSSYDKVLYLLSTCQKYEMDQIQVFIRAEVSRGGFPMPVGTEVFCAYAIASSKRLIPEMENAARLTLDHPMALETLGEALRLFEGSALRDLAHFRKRCRDNLDTCLLSLNLYGSPFNIWMPCTTSYSSSISRTGSPPIWLTNFVQQCVTDLGHMFTRPLPISSNIREEYLSALQTHTVTSGNVTCVTCSVVHAMKGEKFCEELENRLEQAISEVPVCGLI